MNKKIYVLLLLFLINIFIFSIYSKESYTDDVFLFILQKYNGIFTIDSLPRSCKIGYKSDLSLKLFQYILELHKIDIKYLRPRFVKTNDLTKVDIILYENAYNDVSKSKIVDYYSPKNVFHKHLSKYKYGVYNTKENSHLLFITNSITSHKPIQLFPRVSFNPKYNFVIETSIDGRFKEKDVNTNQIILNGNTINDLEVRVGDTILITNQKDVFIEGEYTVVSVSKSNISMEMNVHLPKKDFHCFSSYPSILYNLVSKTQCMFDNRKNVWDHKCRRDIECPEFIDQKATCLNGMCKIPIYHEQISYRKYK